MKKNLKYLLMVLLAIGFFMYFMEGFNPDTECCAPNNTLLSGIGVIAQNRRYSTVNPPPEGLESWWRHQIKQTKCDQAGDLCETDSYSDCEIKTKENAINNPFQIGSNIRIDLCNPIPR